MMPQVEAAALEIEVLTCRIGGLAFTLRAADPAIAAAAMTLCGGYRCPGPGWPLELVGRPPESFPAVTTRDITCVRTSAGFRLQLGAELALEVEESGGRAYLACTEKFFPAGSLQNVLRLCLVLRGQLLLHAAGVVHDGRAFVFAGKSGAGKSTLARCFTEDALLGDEMMCIDAQCLVHRAPFTGERLPPAVPLAAPLGAVVLIVQGPALSIVPARPRELLPHVLNPTYDAAVSLACVDRALALEPVWCMTVPPPTPRGVSEWLDKLAELSRGD